ncbi:MAG: PEP-CTERM sorting domain-containing protein [bacterium]|nr:PEP-CTERM sorting domain-containing protein [bacterium]
MYGLSINRSRFALTALALGCLAVVAAPAGAATIVTFADPAPDGSTPLFELNGPTLVGGWSGTGLELLTPGTPAPDYSDVTFVISPLTVNALGRAAAGAVFFFDALTNPILTITFSEAQLNAPFGFGATEFAAMHDVVFSGPIIPTPLTDESFSFSFANQMPTPGGFTSTAAFTSSAVPEPATLALMAFGAMGLIRRRLR